MLLKRQQERKYVPSLIISNIVICRPLLKITYGAVGEHSTLTVDFKLFITSVDSDTQLLRLLMNSLTFQLKLLKANTAIGDTYLAIS